MIFIRTDANEHIGIGHVMRCNSIARAFIKKGEKVTFITADHKGDALIIDFPVICLDSTWNRMDSEIDKMIELINHEKPKFLLIDSYSITKKYFKEITTMVPTAYMDDMNANRWDVDYIINYNIFANTLDYSWYEKTRTKLLLSPQFTPLREEFRDSPEFEIKLVKHILVSAGGADPEKVTERILESICPKYPDAVFHFIVGALNPRIDIIHSLAGNNVVLHLNEHNMSGLMQNCDIAISAAGTTLYELCAIGIPTITFTLADNQLIAAEQFDKQGIMLCAGDCRNDEGFIGRIEELLDELRNDDALRKKLSEKMRKQIDGLGADRIVDELLRLKQ